MLSQIAGQRHAVRLAEAPNEEHQAGLAQANDAPAHPPPAYSVISLPGRTIAEPGTKYVTGQAPRDFAECEKLLLHVLASRQGAFHIVTRQAQRRPGTDLEHSSLLQLLQGRFESCQQLQQKLILGERFEVQTLSTHSDDRDHTIQLLTVRDLHTQEVFSVPLTRVGLAYDGYALKADDTEKASMFYDAHLRCLGSTASADDGPLILSYGGVGCHLRSSASRNGLEVQNTHRCR
ncbi:MAG: hypothetical protein ACK5NY_04640 [Burkholderiaceae bacterium]